jgi:hypothetical protein
MCTIYDHSGAIISPNGLSCQNRTDYDFLQGEKTATCYYQCPDGSVRRPEIPEEFNVSSPLYSAPKDQIDRQFCQGSALSTATQPLPTDLATDAPTETPATADLPTEQALPSPTAGIVVPNLPPLLRGDVTMCDVGISLINFRMIEPVPDLTGKQLEVKIADQPTTCSINPVNTSLLTCTIPAGVSFPARVFVSLDGATANDFIYDGLGCAKIATAFPTTTP